MILKNIDKEINNLFGKNKTYNEFEKYFQKQWVENFKNKSLFLEKIALKFRTTNFLENFNRIFKIEFNKKWKIDYNICRYFNNYRKGVKSVFRKELKNIPQKANNKEIISNENINIDEKKLLMMN